MNIHTSLLLMFTVFCHVIQLRSILGQWSTKSMYLSIYNLWTILPLFFQPCEYYLIYYATCRMHALVQGFIHQVWLRKWGMGGILGHIAKSFIY